MSKKTMLDYIEESAFTMKKNFENSKVLTGTLVNEYLENHFKNIWIVASGSSYNGAACARIFMERCLGCQVKLISPFQLVHAEHNVPTEDMVIAVSQSGYSKNTMEALDTIKKLKRKAIALTGDMQSDIRNHVDVLIDFGVGVETVGYVTKGVSTLALFLMLFALETARKSGIQSEQDEKAWRNELEKIPEINQRVQQGFVAFLQENIDIFTSMQNAYICSCGANIGTAMEAALKIGETIQIPAICYELEEYIHGPNLQLTPNYTVFFVDGGCASERAYEIFKSTRLVTKRAIFVTNREEFAGEGVFCVPFQISEELTPLCYLPFFQLMSYHVTELLHRWGKHPLQILMKKQVAAKSENYENSPLRLDMPE